MTMVEGKGTRWLHLNSMPSGEIIHINIHWPYVEGREGEEREGKKRKGGEERRGSLQKR